MWEISWEGWAAERTSSRLVITTVHVSVESRLWKLKGESLLSPPWVLIA